MPDIRCGRCGKHCWAGALVCWGCGEVLEGATTTAIADTPRLPLGDPDMMDRILRAADQLAGIRQEIATRAVAAPATVARLFRSLPVELRGTMHIEGIPVCQDPEMPEGLVRFFNADGRMIHESNLRRKA